MRSVWATIGLIILISTVSGMTLDQIATTCLPPTPGGNCTCSLNINWTFTGAPGTDALVTDVGIPPDYAFDFIIPRGDKGDVGEMNQTPGENGSNGSPGSAATIDVNNTETLPAGSPATVTNIGSTSAALLDFGIPQGIEGPMNQTPNMTAGPPGAPGPDNDAWYYWVNATRALTGNSIFRDVNNDYLYLTGGDGSTPYSANLQLYGGDNVAMSGGFILAVGNASGDTSEVVASALGRTDTPALDLSNNKITSLADPTNAQDAATKNYVDVHASNYNASYWTGSNYNASYLTSTYNSTYDGLIGKAGYTIFVQAPAQDPSKSVVRYFGNLPAGVLSTASGRAIYIQKAGTITSVDVISYASTVVGTNEAWRLDISVNNGTRNLVANVSLATAQRRFSNTALNIPVVEGDYIEMQTTSPNWVTSPTGVSWAGNVYVAT